MELNRFNTILEAYGASPERWPEGEREAALALTRSSVVAARALMAARAIDTALSDAASADAERFAMTGGELDLLHDRILAAATARRKSWAAEWFGLDLTATQLWPSVAGLSFAMILGFAAGFGGVLQSSTGSDIDEIAVIPSFDIAASGSFQ